MKKKHETRSGERSTPSSKAPSESLNPLEKAVQEFRSFVRASGRTMTVVEPSDTDEFVATFPQRPKPRARNPSGKVKVGVEWGYDMHYLEMPLRRWVEICDGASDSFTSVGRYEGTRFKIYWSFDPELRDSLTVTYGGDGGGGQGFIGSIAALTVSGPVINGIDVAHDAHERLKKNLKSRARQR